MNNISHTPSVFCLLSASGEQKLKSEEFMRFNYEEVFVNMVNHITLQFGDQGKDWLHKMTKEWIG